MGDQLSRKNEQISASLTLAITAKAKKMKADGIDVVSFGAGEPDFNTPSNIRKAAIDAMESGQTGYTAASGLVELKKAICEKFQKDNQLKYTPENIVVSNGAKHSLFNVLQALCNPNDEVIISVPYWVSYPELVKLADAQPILVKTEEKNGFKYTKESLEKAITKNTKAIILNSPNNPTGTVYTREELQMIGELALKHNFYIISDEIYEKLIYEGEHTSIASLSDAIKEKTIVVNGMSKAYAMTGWRIGYLAAQEKIVKMINNIQSHATSNPNTMAQYASIEALRGDQKPLEEMRKAFLERRNYMVKKINSIKKLSCSEPKGAFYVMVNISKVIGKTFEGTTINGSMDFAQYMLQNSNVAVVPGIAFGADKYVRLSYATSLENIQKGLDRIQKALEQ